MAKASLGLTRATLEKTYTTSANNITEYSSSYTPTAQLLYRLKVELMKVPGATVVASSDGSTSGASDLWSGPNKTTIASAGARSWIVIKFDNMGNDATVMLSSLVDSTSLPTQFGTMSVSFDGATNTYDTSGGTTANPVQAAAYAFTFSGLPTYTLNNQLPVVSSICYSSDGKNFTSILSYGHYQFVFGLYEGVKVDQQATTFDTVLVKQPITGVTVAGESVVARIGGSNTTMTADMNNQSPFIYSREASKEYLFQPAYQGSTFLAFQYIKDVYRTQSSGFTYQPGTLFPNAQDPALVCIGELLVPWTGPSPTVFY